MVASGVLATETAS